MALGRSGRLVFAGFLAVVASFVAAGAFQEYDSRAISQASEDLETNAMPSIRHLAALGEDVRTAEYLLDRWIDLKTGGRPADRQALEAALSGLAEEERSYLKLPRFDGEDALADAIEQADIDFRRAVDQAIVEYQDGRLDEAQTIADTLVSPAADRLDRRAARAIDFNAGQSSRLAALIQRTRRRGIIYRWILDGLCALLAVAAASVLWRSLRRSQATQEQYARLLERRAQELELFAGRVAHDILSPLAAVRLSLTMASRKAEARERELIARGDRALSRVEQLTDGLLDFARAGAAPGPDDHSPIAPVVEGVIEETRPAAAEANAQLVVGPLPDLQVACAPGILTSLLSNLVRNALKYLGDSPLRRVSVRVVERGERVRFEVEDSGPGVEPELAGRIFQPYVRGAGTGQPGLGLGLATVKRLAESHHGAVGLATRPGSGSTFWFELPRTRLVAPAAREEERPSLH